MALTNTLVSTCANRSGSSIACGSRSGRISAVSTLRCVSRESSWRITARITALRSAGTQPQLARPGQLDQIADHRFDLADVVQRRVDESGVLRIALHRGFEHLRVDLDRRQRVADVVRDARGEQAREGAAFRCGPSCTFDSSRRSSIWLNARPSRPTSSSPSRARRLVPPRHVLREAHELVDRRGHAPRHELADRRPARRRLASAVEHNRSRHGARAPPPIPKTPTTTATTVPGRSITGRYDTKHGWPHDISRTAPVGVAAAAPATTESDQRLRDGSIVVAMTDPRLCRRSSRRRR